MSTPEPRPPGGYHRYSREGFQPLNGGGDTTIDIPMQRVAPPYPAMNNEKVGLFHGPGVAGFRRSINPGAIAGATKVGGTIPNAPRVVEEEEGTLTKMGMFYKKFKDFSIVTKYLVYVFPLGLLLSVPIIIGATAAKHAAIGPAFHHGGVPIVWFFTWLLVCWVGLWVSKIIAHCLPGIFQFLCGFVSAGTRKYALVISSLELPLSVTGWALVSLATFKPICTQTPNSPGGEPAGNNAPHWIDIMERILAAILIGTLIFLVERIFIQAISINYHRKQFTFRITDSKRNIHLLGLLYDASRAAFPVGCPELAEEDAAISDSIMVKGKKGRGEKNSGTATPMQIVQNVGKVGDKLTMAFGNMANEVAGKNVFNADSAHSIVVEALEKNRSAEALAKRLWLSFVIEGHDALYLEDVVEVLGNHRQAEAEECFASLDRDNNGDVSLDEMILTVTEFGRERHAIANSMHDVDAAINVLDRLLLSVVCLAVVLIFVAFLNQSFITTLATTGTALLSLSFVFSATAQEVLGSCIFLFVKHPFDIGDRIEIKEEQLVVEHISLLFTVFKKVKSNQLVQIPNIVLNTLWIENISRSQAMREQLTIPVDFSTTFEDIQLLKTEMSRFVNDKDNNRDFFPDVEIQTAGINEMDKLELLINISHKSNWANETVRAARRSKFMCALVLALRKVPIAGPGGANADLGSSDNPTYSVAISDAVAVKNKQDFVEKQEASRLVPSRKTTDSKVPDRLGPLSETKAMSMLNERSPAVDGARDSTAAFYGFRDVDRNKSEMQELEEVRGVLRRTTTRGRRKSGRSDKSSTSVSSMSGIVRSASGPRVGVTAPSSMYDVQRSRSYRTSEDSDALPRMSSRPSSPGRGYLPTASQSPRPPLPPTPQQWRG